MPIYVGNSQNRRKIRIVSAGAPQYYAGRVVCLPPSVFLQATLNDDTNLRNHAFEWDFLDGEGIPPVDLAPVPGPLEETRASFSPPADLLDQEYRFYIDRGTNRELYADTKIYYTPTSFVKKALVTGVKTNASVTVPNIEFAPTSLPPEDGSFVPYFETPNGVRIRFDRASSPGLSGNQYALQVLYSSSGTGDPTEVYAEYNKYNWPRSLAVPRGAYKIVVSYKINNGRIVSYTSPVINAASTVYGRSIGTNDYISAFSATGNISNIRRIAPQVQVLFDILPEQRMGESTGLTNLERFGAIVIDDGDYPALLSQHSIKYLVSGELTNFERFNSLSVGAS